MDGLGLILEEDFNQWTVTFVIFRFIWRKRYLVSLRNLTGGSQRGKIIFWKRLWEILCGRVTHQAVVVEPVQQSSENHAP